jgi:hypothetical protein
MLTDSGVRALLKDAGIDPDNLPFGAIIGTIQITKSRPMNRMPVPDSVDEALGNWAPDRYAFRGEDPIIFDTPVPFRGVQTPFFNVPDDVLSGYGQGIVRIAAERPAESGWLFPQDGDSIHRNV